MLHRQTTVQPLIPSGQGGGAPTVTSPPTQPTMPVSQPVSQPVVSRTYLLSYYCVFVFKMCTHAQVAGMAAGQEVEQVIC